MSNVGRFKVENVAGNRPINSRDKGRGGRRAFLSPSVCEGNSLHRGLLNTEYHVVPRCSRIVVIRGKNFSETDKVLRMVSRKSN